MCSIELFNCNEFKKMSAKIICQINKYFQSSLKNMSTAILFNNINRFLKLNWRIDLLKKNPHSKRRKHKNEISE